MSPGAAAYQRQVSGHHASRDYRVRRGGVTADFDGYRQGVLLDAKAFGPRSGIVRARELGLRGMIPESLLSRVEGLVDLAQRQIRVAGKTPIHWHIASREAAQATKELLRTQGLTRQGRRRGIQVVYTPPSPHVQRLLGWR